MCRLNQTESGEISSEKAAEIRTVLKKKYAEVASTSKGKFEYPVGKDGANALGYDREMTDSAGHDFLESFCGVGNPFSLGDIQPGNRVLDIGSGAGFDLYVASRLVGANGSVCGIDLTEEMVKRSRHNLERAGVDNAEIKKVDSDSIPYKDNFFDIVISNGVINLSPTKETMFREIYRVLKPGGKLQFADIVLDKELPENLKGSLEAWSQ